jgi:hypothetical protein
LLLTRVDRVDHRGRTEVLTDPLHRLVHERIDVAILGNQSQAERSGFAVRPELDAGAVRGHTRVLVVFSMTISTVLVPIPSAGSLYCAWATNEIVNNATAAPVNLTKRIILPLLILVTAGRD